MLLASFNNAPAIPIEESVEPDAKMEIGAHFAGLVKREPETMPHGIRNAPVANDDEIDDEGDEREDDACIASSRGVPDRWSKAARMQIIGKRLVEARTLNGCSQTEAAQLLQYGTPAQLSQWEQCRRAVPLHMLIRFADLMGVSLDWLTGISSDPNRDVRAIRRNACIRAVRATLVSAVDRIVDAFDSDESIVGLNVSMVRDLASAAEAVAATYGDFAQPNHAAGRRNVADRLDSAVDRLEGAALKVGIALRRHDDEDAMLKRRLTEIAANDSN